MFLLARLLLVLLLTYQHVVQAVDAPSDSEPRMDGRSKRTLYNIIWGCLSTTIICAWTAIHPNIPPREGPVKRTLRRLELMFWTIVAPEILPAWALNQWLAAKTVKDVYNEGKGYEQEKRGIWKFFKGLFRKDHKCGIWKTLKRWFSFYEIKEAASKAWTENHGHFLIMGGFHLVELVERDSTPPEAPTGTQPAATGAVTDIVRATVEGTETDAERGRAPSENEPELEEGRVTILTLEMLRELVKDTDFGIRITEEEVADRSKGDALSKFIFILQSSWFICQCIGRYVQGLGVTQLELTTLALASLNGITFILWWSKPLGVRAPLRVYMKRKLTDAERNVARQRRRQSGRSWISMLSFMTAAIHNFQCQFEISWNTLLLPLIIPLVILNLLLLSILGFGFAFSATVSDLIGGVMSFPVEATHVPTFYVPSHRYSKWWHITLLLALGTIFGAIHCAGWNLPFPTAAEQKLWRVASLALTVIPIIVFPVLIYITVFLSVLLVVVLIVVLISRLLAFISRLLGLISRSLGLSGLSSFFDRISNGLSNFPVIPSDGISDGITHILEYGLTDVSFRDFIAFLFGNPVYAFGRLVLLGLALALLRHQPPSAFIAIDWTQFYPHVL